MRIVRVSALAGLLALGGCGFQPLYGTQGGRTAHVSEQLQRVYVANIPERYGQELRLALQQDFGGTGGEHPDGYTLHVYSYAAAQAIDIHSDNTSGRMREEGHAHWSLYTVAPEPSLLAQGDTYSLDGYTPTFEQYFAQTLDDETAQNRVAQTLADQITQQVAIWMRTHVKPPEAEKDYVPSYVDPNAMPSANGQPMEKAGPDGFPASATGRLDQNSNGDDQ